eukprot:gnl/MRDRNA2_/MRDRNA2_86120_c0_seq5.p1 gnl/MRDRNA2_/MRDRNA2_86120_c0~~gnl/MRDRNA2_/MRDRNA2_86120_c0_seq5.p1  ORF type:complete len:447 (+),score=87.03 gnl/MRDRNA2_/MRDRNA2_86120_c0_seq5:196-1341(+)
MDQPLYGVVDLLGNTVSVALDPDAVPPSCVFSSDEVTKIWQEEKSKMSGFVDPQRRKSRMSMAERSMKRNTFKRNIEKREGTETKDSEMQRRLPAAKTIEFELPPAKHIKKRAGPAEHPLLFCPHVSSHVTLSKDLLTGVLNDTPDDEDDLFGVILTQHPIPEFEEGLYFEVQVKRVINKHDDGLTIGVTTTSPKDLEAFLPELPEVAAAVTTNWVVGFTGMAHCSIGEWQSCPHDGNFVDVDWKPQDLKIGDRVGVFVTYEGLLIVVENGYPVAICPQPVAMDMGPLYGIVDLLGNTMGAALIPDPVPPPRVANVGEAKKFWEKEKLKMGDGKPQARKSRKSMAEVRLAEVRLESLAGIGKLKTNGKLEGIIEDDDIMEL